MRGKKVTWGLLALAVILLLGSTLGSTRAALRPAAPAPIMTNRSMLTPPS